MEGGGGGDLFRCVFKICERFQKDYFFRYGATPLHHAAASDFKEVAECLLKAGANPNVEDIGGGAPLAQAVEMGSSQLHTITNRIRC